MDNEQNLDRFFNKKKLYLHLGLLLLFVVGMFLLYKKLMSEVIGY